MKFIFRSNHLRIITGAVIAFFGRTSSMAFLDPPTGQLELDFSLDQLISVVIA